MFFRLASLARLAKFLRMDASILLEWDGETVAGLLEAFRAFEDVQELRRRMKSESRR